jgi:hypothetical protein
LKSPDESVPEIYQPRKQSRRRSIDGTSALSTQKSSNLELLFVQNTKSEIKIPVSVDKNISTSDLCLKKVLDTWDKSSLLSSSNPISMKDYLQAMEDDGGVKMIEKEKDENLNNLNSPKKPVIVAPRRLSLVCSPADIALSASEAPKFENLVLINTKTMIPNFDKPPIVPAKVNQVLHVSDESASETFMSIDDIVIDTTIYDASSIFSNDRDKLIGMPTIDIQKAALETGIAISEEEAKFNKFWATWDSYTNKNSDQSISGVDEAPLVDTVDVPQNREIDLKLIRDKQRVENKSKMLADVEYQRMIWKRTVQERDTIMSLFLIDSKKTIFKK